MRGARLMRLTQKSLLFNVMEPSRTGGRIQGNCEFAMYRRVLEANSSSLRGFTLGHLLAVKLVCEHALFKEELEFPQTSRDLLFGKLGFGHYRVG